MHLKEIDANLLVILDALLVDASVTRAAERLGRSASAISHALAKLRELFDDELFVRAGQRLVPTAKAQELAPTVHVILAGMESLLRSDKAFDPSLSARAFAAACDEAGELILLQPLRARLAHEAPSMQLDWKPIPQTGALDALREARCHFFIDVAGTPADAPDLRSETLFNDRLATLARPGHAFAGASPDAAAFAAEEHVSVHALPGVEGLRAGLRNAGHPIWQSSEVSSTLGGVLAALNSNALFTLPASLAGTLERQFGLVPVQQPAGPVTFPVRLLCHASYDRDECHQWLRESFSDIAGTLTSDTAPAA